MSMTLVLTKIYQDSVELDDEQEAQYREAKETNEEDYFLDAYLSNLELVETTIEEV
jgi:hypothetical protein